MKKLRHLLTVLLLLCSVVANAQDFEVDGIYYNIHTEERSVEVTSSGSYYNSYNGSVVIPESVTYRGVTYSVTSIGRKAFYGCSGLTSITIPNSVTSIENSAFYDCTGLKTVINFSNKTFSKGASSNGYVAYYADEVYNVPNGSKEGDYIFGKLDNVYRLLYYLGNDTDLILPENCNGENYVISEKIFADNKTIKSVVIPNSVTSIGESAFSGCSGLTSVTIGNSVTSIGNSAFQDCSGLTSITIPNSVTSIGEYAFSNCTGLTSVTIPNSVTNIDYEAFSGCSSLTSVTIGNSVTSIGEMAFQNCSGLTSITIPNSVTSIGRFAFHLCSGLTSVTIGNSVTSIGYSAFSWCTSLASIVIPNSVTSIGDYAFCDCSGLASIVIPNSVTSIGSDAFYGCSGLKEVHISDLSAWCNIDIGNYCANPLYYAHNLYLNGGIVTDLVIPDGVTEIKDHAFNDCSLTSVEIPNSVTNIDYRAFSGCTSLASVSIPNSVTSIGERAFSYCSALTSATIGSGVTSIGNYAFYSCSGLASIVIPNGVTSIGENAFSWCTSLKSVTIGNGVTSIGNDAFHNCTSLTSVTIGNSVTSIGNEAFFDCYRLKTVYNSSSLTFTKGSTDYGYIAYYADEIILPKTTYALTFVVDGEVFRTDSIEYGDEIVLPEMEEREGCTFSGWKRVVDKISIDIAADADRMLYSNAPCTNTTYNDQFVSWDVLFDNNAKTIFHSEYGNTQTVDGLDHYIRVDMGEGNSVGLFEFTYMTREGNDRVSPKTIVVEGSNEAFGEYTEIATLTNLPGEASTTYNSDILGDDNIKYRYIRYRVTETSAGDMDNGHPFFAISEFGMSRVYNDVPTTMPGFGFTLEGSYIPNAISSISELKKNVIYHVSQPHHSSGKTAWAIIPEISDEIIANDWFVNVSLYDECQQFAFISNDNGKTHYLYHPAEKVFVNKDGSLSETPVDAISFKDGAYENTFVVYFDNEHYININAEITLDINGWNTPDGGNSCLLVPVGTFDPTDVLRAIDNATAIENVECEETETVIYDLQGRRIKEITASGIYIINGKKTILR